MSQPVPPATVHPTEKVTPVRRVPRVVPDAPKGDEGRQMDETPTAGEILITTLATDSLLDGLFGKSDSDAGSGFDGFRGGDFGGGGAGGDW